MNLNIKSLAKWDTVCVLKFVTFSPFSIFSFWTAKSRGAQRSQYTTMTKEKTKLWIWQLSTGNGSMIKLVWCYRFCSSFLLTLICFTKYFPMPITLLPFVFVVHAAFYLTEAAKHVISKFPGLLWSSYKTPKEKQHNRKIWAGLPLTSINTELLKLNTHTKRIKEIPDDLWYSEPMACKHPHLSAWCMCLWVLPFQWTGSFPGQRLLSFLNTVLYITVLEFVLYVSI